MQIRLGEISFFIWIHPQDQQKRDQIKRYTMRVLLEEKS